MLNRFGSNGFYELDEPEPTRVDVPDIAVRAALDRIRQRAADLFALLSLQAG